MSNLKIRNLVFSNSTMKAKIIKKRSNQVSQKNLLQQFLKKAIKMVYLDMVDLMD
jgi:hypothetical protein